MSSEVPNGAGLAPGETGVDQGASLAQRAATAVRAEQRRIAQALHDTVSQTLTGAYLQASMIARNLEGSGSERAEEVAHLAEMIHQAVVELQDAMRQLQSASEGTASSFRR